MPAIFSPAFLEFFTDADAQALHKEISANTTPLRIHQATPSLLIWLQKQNPRYRTDESPANPSDTYIIRLYDDEGVIAVHHKDTGYVTFHAHKETDRSKIGWRLLFVLYYIRKEKDVELILPDLAYERAVSIGDKWYYMAADEMEMWTILTEKGIRCGGHEAPEKFPVLLDIRPIPRGLVSAPIHPYVVIPWVDIDRLAFNLRHLETIHIKQK